MQKETVRRALVTGAIQVPTLSESEATWLACAVDGEGYIGLYHETPMPGKWPTVNVSVINTDRRFVDYAARLMSGFIRTYPQTSKSSHYGNKDLHRAEIKGHRMVLALLKQIEPYLIIKRDKANYVMNFIQSRKWGMYKRGGGIQ